MAAAYALRPVIVMLQLDRHKRRALHTSRAVRVFIIIRAKHTSRVAPLGQRVLQIPDATGPGRSRETVQYINAIRAPRQLMKA